MLAIPRRLEKRLKEDASFYPAVTIFGPRQPTVIYDGEAHEFSDGVTAANYRHWEP